MTLAALAIVAALKAEVYCEAPRTEGPEGMSAVTRVSRDTYFCVDDRGGWLHEVSMSIVADGISFRTNRAVRLDGRRDLEGCAYDPLAHCVWVSDEADTSVRAYDPSTGRQLAALDIPEVYRGNVRRHRSLESLAISPDGLRLYTANEESLKCDATNVVRIQEFSRGGARDAFRPSRQFMYDVDPAGGRAFGKRTFSGVSSLLAMSDGSLLVLEREFSVKVIPSFRIRIYRIVPGESGKSLVWEEPSTFSNYEGMCMGPTLPDGRRSLVLVSDGGSGALESVLVLGLR